jgi:hypothetical protein
MSKGTFYWDEIGKTSKELIKKKVLEVLESPINEVMKSGATILAVIASIELLRGE